MSTPRKGGKRPLVDRVHKFIGEFPDIRYDGSQIWCDVCNIPLMCWDRYNCKRHVNGVAHATTKSGVSLRTQFMFDLLVMLITCNIPLTILENKSFKEFWNKYSEVELPSRTALRTYLPRLLRVMYSTKPTHPLLLTSKRLQKCTAEAITRVILETLENFQLLTSQVLLFVTDGAATMLSVGRSLKEHGCSFFTCYLTIRNCFPEVDSLISSTKKVFLKSPKRLRAFHTQCPGVSEPPQPIITRWGTWLEAAFYYAKYFTQIKSVLLQFNPKEAAAIKGKSDDISK
ncbi:hypothetical protein NQ318_018544 [Aromia moschata]|uniref:Transposase n=1 Tax=Aromia moschata TaxID=1265417 RepID=A0AAV8ZFF7_9CUCU|nr:hypothetical protein NQ318_018544 [Aromia moschata]